MKSRCALSILLVGVVMGSSTELLACGAKFLVVGRGTRFQHAAARRDSAAILVYGDRDSSVANVVAHVPVDVALRKAGYRPTVVTSADEFDKALRQGGWNLILVDTNESQAVRSRLPQGALVLSVAHGASSAELKQARKQHEGVLKSPMKQQEFVEAIDDALADSQDRNRKVN